MNCGQWTDESGFGLVVTPAGSISSFSNLSGGYGCQSVRAMAVGDLNSAPPIKNTPISEKNLRATVFAVERSQSGDAWGDVFAEWKKRDLDKEWGFASTQSFIAATRKTYERLMGRSLQWKRKRGERK